MLDKSLRKNKKGEVMVEALVAISVAVVGLLGVFEFVSRSFSLNRVIADQYVGTYLAAEGIELVKNLVDSHPWNSPDAIPDADPTDYEIDFQELSLQPIISASQPLLFDDQYYNYSNGQPTKFHRIISIDPTLNNGDEIKVVSRVSWSTRGGGQSKSEVESHFFNLQQ
ncbi:MAG: hypothetical protein Q8P76_04070 [bacterium]|nr:hypothetical protein [bacterium]